MPALQHLEPCQTQTRPTRARMHACRSSTSWPQRLRALRHPQQQQHPQPPPQQQQHRWGRLPALRCTAATCTTRWSWWPASACATPTLYRWALGLAPWLRLERMRGDASGLPVDMPVQGHAMHVRLVLCLLNHPKPPLGGRLGLAAVTAPLPPVEARVNRRRRLCLFRTACRCSRSSRTWQYTTATPRTWTRTCWSSPACRP